MEKFISCTAYYSVYRKAHSNWSLTGPDLWENMSRTWVCRGFLRGLRVKCRYWACPVVCWAPCPAAVPCAARQSPGAWGTGRRSSPAPSAALWSWGTWGCNGATDSCQSSAGGSPWVEPERCCRYRGYGGCGPSTGALVEARYLSRGCPSSNWMKKELICCHTYLHNANCINMMIVHYDLYTHLLVMISWDKQAGANMALSIKTIKGQSEVSLTVKHLMLSRLKSWILWEMCLRDVFEGVSEFAAQVLDVSPLALLYRLTRQMDVINCQLSLIEQPLNHKHRHWEQGERHRHTVRESVQTVFNLILA